MRNRRKLSYLTSWSRHATRLAYYRKGILHHLTPFAICERETRALLEASRTHPERDDIEARAAYYNRLTTPFDATDAPRIADIDRSRSRYFLDLNAAAKGFGPDRRLHYEFGDITHIPDRPTIVKSRPVGKGNENSVLLNLNALRHFTWSGDAVPFRDKIPAAVWRGIPRTERRRRLVERFYDHPTFDIGHSGREVGGRPPKPALSQSEQKRYRFFLSIEGNDVATNLKWSMASNMLVMSPALHFETWFMEGALEPGRHFVELREDFADLEEKVAHYDAHPEEAEEIIANAHAWMARFGDPLKERMIAARVLERYFDLSGQA